MFGADGERFTCNKSVFTECTQIIYKLINFAALVVFSSSMPRFFFAHPSIEQNASVYCESIVKAMNISLHAIPRPISGCNKLI